MIKGYEHIVEVLPPRMQQVLDNLPIGAELTADALGRPSQGTLDGLVRRNLIRKLWVPASKRWPRGVAVYKRVPNASR
jgi:hypothetical protein